MPLKHFHRLKLEFDHATKQWHSATSLEERQVVMRRVRDLAAETEGLAQWVLREVYERQELLKTKGLFD